MMHDLGYGYKVEAGKSSVRLWSNDQNFWLANGVIPALIEFLQRVQETSK